MPSGTKQELGRLGEDQAVAFLIKAGYKILGRNIWFSFGEIDILSQKDDDIAIVEVKTVSRASVYDPLDKTGGRKSLTLQRLAAAVSQKYPDYYVQVDVLTLYWDAQGELVITHFANLFS